MVIKMLNQTDIYTSDGDISDIKSDITVKIHGAVMTLIKAEYAEKLHKQEYHPFSIFTLPRQGGYLIRISSLNTEAEQLASVLCKEKKLTIFGMSEPLEIVGYDKSSPVRAEMLEEYVTQNICRLNFVTPAVIKTGGKPCCKPDIAKYFYSVILKYNAFEKNQLSFNDFQNAFDSADFGSFSLQSVFYNVSGNNYPGMTGFCDVKLPKNRDQADLLKKVFAYATYSGVGGKTALGMGGFILT
jgi:CRISPR-associated endoribonuclease Cas6